MYEAIDQQPKSLKKKELFKRNIREIVEGKIHRNNVQTFVKREMQLGDSNIPRAISEVNDASRNLIRPVYDKLAE